ncbi:AraC-type DNA-binding protein [Geodermatophilus obscurus]|uniref:AraC-type DNA-binding protein n=1 Tax=Geodermatophilus obscurus TaxID=1861 RepID=A0A1I5CWN9_9ACTN|nr:AraC family transcriptional regulator [Geodermatophilus obscurus]SFN91420.1 AraC-type DNA-binding protein [Geodermatophilus obscurus]
MDGGPSRILATPLPEPLAGPVHEEHGLACRLSTRPVMRRAHRHDDVELALAVGGWVEHEHAGRPTAALLRGGRLVLPGRHDDAARFARWAADLAGGVPAEARAARLEARALLERLSVAAPGPGDDAPVPVAGTAGERHARQVARMTAFVAARFREPIGVAEVAAAAHLHPATATAAFRAVTGTTPGAFLLHCRLAEARRLLLVTTADVGAVARRAGFGSTSSFYAAFTREVGEPPAAWRRRRGAVRAVV